MLCGRDPCLVSQLQAYFLVADDIMDKSLTRRGKKCWYLVDTVQYDAVNDSLLLESFIFFMLKMYFDKSPHYLQLLELFNEVSTCRSSDAWTQGVTFISLWCALARRFRCARSWAK